MRYAMAIALSVSAGALVTGCDQVGGARFSDAAYAAPDRILDFEVLYRSNCAGCHGPQGRGGAATALANPIYLAMAGDAAIRRATADGVTGTPMPAFARRSGGMLTDQQIDAIVAGIRGRWGKQASVAGVDVPPYADPEPGDARRGAEVFSIYCESCHGAGGGGAPGGSSIVDRSYLALVSDQGLRTTVILGLPDLGAPDWRGNVRGREMSSREISDVVAWLSARRRHFPEDL